MWQFAQRGCCSTCCTVPKAATASARRFAEGPQPVVVRAENDASSSRESIERFLSDGAQRVVIGTRALEDPDWLMEVSTDFPGCIVVAADVRDRKILSHGWTRVHPKLVLDLVEDLNGLPLAGVLVTAVHRETAMRGTDLPLMEDVAEAAEFPVFASGGLGSVGDLRALADRGVAAAVIGMGLYSGAMDPWAVADEFSE